MKIQPKSVDKPGPVMLTVQDIADRTGVSASGIRKKLKDGEVPGAVLVQMLKWPQWFIPESALVVFEHRPRGRPRKPDEELKQPRHKDRGDKEGNGWIRR